MATRVLLVDDNTDTVTLLAQNLGRHDCDVRFTGDPHEALRIAAEFLPQAVCVDIGMPAMDGYTLARAIRQVPGLEACRIVALSGYPADHERLEKAGIDVHILKPVAAKVLSQALCESTRHALQ